MTGEVLRRLVLPLMMVLAASVSDKAMSSPLVFGSPPVRPHVPVLVDTSMSAMYPWSRERAPVELLADPQFSERLLTSLARLDGGHLPVDEDELMQLFDSCFPDTFVRRASGMWSLNYVFDVYRWRLIAADFDGLRPTDYALYMDASVDGEGQYSILTVVRSESLVVYQTFEANMEGVYAMIHRSGEADPRSIVAQAARCKWLAHVCDVDWDGRDDLVVHDRAWWWPHVQTRCAVDTMRAYPCDLPVPYSWDGRRLSFWAERAGPFYDEILSCSDFLTETDADIVRCCSSRMTLKRIGKIESGLAPN